MRNVVYILIAVICLNIGALMVLAYQNYYFIPLLIIGAFFLLLTFLVSIKNHDLEHESDTNIDQPTNDTSGVAP